MGNKSSVVYLSALLLIASTYTSLGQVETPGRVGPGAPSRGSAPTPQEVPRDLFLSGTVVLQGGNALPSPAQVRLICNGAVRQVVQTSEDGRFDLVLGSGAPNTATVDPSISGTRHRGVPSATLSDSESRDPFRTAGTGRMMPFNRVDLSECHCDATLPGYRGAPIRLGYRSVFDSPDIGVITLQSIEGVKGTTVSFNTLNAPKKAKEAFEKAGKELHKEKIDYSEVKKHLEKAKDIYPEFAAAWQLLGQVNLALGDREAARESFQQSRAADPNYVTPYVSLAELEIQENHWEESLQLTGQAIALNPHVIRAHYFHAVAHYYMQHDAEAEEAIRKVQESDEGAQYPSSHYLLGGIFAARGEYETAATEYRRFLQTRPHRNLVDEVEAQMSEWERKGLIQTPKIEPQVPEKEE